MKEQLLEGKSINIEGLGVFMLTARSKGAELAKDVNAKSVDSVRIFFQANKELRVTKTATRADEKLDLISLDEYLKKISVTVSPTNPENRVKAKMVEMMVMMVERHRIPQLNALTINS